MSNKLDPITRVIEADDYEWLLDNAFPYFCAVEDAVNRGADPGEIFRHMMRQTHDGRQGLAIRCRNAASHMIRNKNDEALGDRWSGLVRDLTN